MNNFLIELENDVISLCLANTLFRSEIEKHILMNQYVHCTHHIELTGKGFYDNIIVCKDCKKVNNKDFTLCDIY